MSTPVARVPLAAAVPLCSPWLHGTEMSEVARCLAEGWVSTAGPVVLRFEQQLADLTGRKFAVATASGTAALHLACLAAGVRENDEVIMPALSFIAPANAVRYVGAQPVFLDCDAEYWQLDPNELELFFRSECRWRSGALWNRQTGRRVAAVLAVHILGHAAQMPSILEIAKQFELPVIEDAAEALGAAYGNQMAGSFGDVACLSFNGNKLITTGAGGAFLTDHEDWAVSARHLAGQAKLLGVNYVHDAVGYNYRLSSLPAALGISQLQWFSEHLTAKRRIAEVYVSELRGLSGIVPMTETPWGRSSFWMYTVLVRQHCAASPGGRGARDALQRHLADRGIESRPLWEPLGTNPPYRDCQSYRCRNAERISAMGLSLPCSANLTAPQQAEVIQEIRLFRETERARFSR